MVCLIRLEFGVKTIVKKCAQISRFEILEMANFSIEASAFGDMVVPLSTATMADSIFFKNISENHVLDGLDIIPKNSGAKILLCREKQIGSSQRIRSLNEVCPTALILHIDRPYIPPRIQICDWRWKQQP